jgi:two-component system sensor histidine kinase AtoS
MLPSLSFLRRRQLSLNDIESFLDVFPQAALLVDLQGNEILIANAQATELTSFTRNELMDLDLDYLIPALGEMDHPQGIGNAITSFTTTIISRRGTKVEVFLTLNRLNTQSSIALVVFEGEAHHRFQQAEKQRQSKLYDLLFDLIQTTQENDFREAIQTALKTGHTLTGASILAIYIVDPQPPGLKRIANWGPAKELPEQIPASDVIQILETPLWIPGKRATCDLLRSARAAKYAYLASAILGQPGKFSGLIVIADPQTSPATNLPEVLKIIAAVIMAIVQQKSLTSNLIEQNQIQSISLSLADTVKESVREGVIILGSDQKIIEMNPSAEWILGYASREVTGQPIENVIIGAENLISALQSAQQGIPTHNLGNVRIHRRDGSAFLALIRILPVFYKNKYHRAILLIWDLSEREQYQARNQQLEQRALLGEITAIFAHEVRNPINNISTGLQLISYNLPEDDPNQEIITRLGTDCDRLAHLMQSVLSFSHPSQSRMEKVDLGSLVHRILERWRPRMARVNVEHKLTITAKNPLINGDPRSLEQVFTNLISNAIQAMGEKGGMLTVHLRSITRPGERRHIEVSVADNGPGIPEDILEHIFEPFFTTNSEGTGLGLAIAKRIIIAHKGTIDVASVPGGTVFQIRFPATERNET